MGLVVKAYLQGGFNDGFAELELTLAELDSPVYQIRMGR